MSKITRNAVIDRWESDFAVVFFNDAPDLPVDIPRERFSRRKPKGGAYLKIVMQDDEIVKITTDRAATNAARQRIADKLARLRRGDHLRDTPESEP